MTQPTPYGKAEDLALENERLRGLVKELRIQRAEFNHLKARSDALEEHTKELEAISKRQESAFLGLTDALDAGEATDGFHTHQELYEARMLYHAHAVRLWVDVGVPVAKSRYHSNRELCFGGGWFIVVAELPGGQISQHYRLEHWDLFECPSVDTPPEFDGHTTQDTHQRLKGALGIEES